VVHLSGQVTLIEELLKQRREKRWCAKPYCTTCGALEFRGHLTRLVCQKLGLQIPQETQHKGFPLLDDLSREDRQLCVEEIIKSLRLLEKPTVNEDEGIRLILILCDDFYGGLPILNNKLSGTWVGDELNAMRQHSYQVDQRRASYDEYNSADRIRERREEKQAHKQKKIFQRKQVKAQRDQARKLFLDKFSKLSELDRLSEIASEELDIALDVIPPELIPQDPKIIQKLSAEQKTRLREKIGRRSGKWRRLKILLQ